MRIKEFPDSFANLLSDFCHDVEIEPHLQPLQGKTFALKSKTTDDDTGLDTNADGLGNSGSTKQFDVKIFRPLAKKSSKAVAKPRPVTNL